MWKLGLVVAVVWVLGWQGVAREFEMCVEEAETGVRLAGTLRLPEGEGPYPVVVFVQAAGAHPRDEARSEGQHWARLGEALAAQGVGSLRYDNPGTGGSVNEEVAGWEERWTIEDRARWAGAALDWARAREDVEANAVGLLGFIDGGHAAVMVAAGAPEKVAFVVMLSSSGVSGAENLVAQQTAPLIAGGAPEEKVRALDEALTDAIGRVVEGCDEAACIEALGRALGVLGVPEEQRDAAAQGVYGNLSTRSARDYMSFEPSALLGRVQGPVMAIVGGDDERHVHPESVGRVREALDAEWREDRRVEVLEGLGHFLEAEGERVFAPEVVDLVGAWVWSQIEGESLEQTP